MNDLLMFAQATAPAGAQAQPGWVNLIPFLIIFAMFYFVLIRPQMKKQKEHDAMVKAVKTGDKVIAAGGIHGVISNVKEGTVLLKVDDNVKLEVQKESILSVVKPSEK